VDRGFLPLMASIGAKPLTISGDSGRLAKPAQVGAGVVAERMRLAAFRRFQKVRVSRASFSWAPFPRLHRPEIPEEGSSPYLLVLPIGDQCRRSMPCRRRFRQDFRMANSTEIIDSSEVLAAINIDNRPRHKRRRVGRQPERCACNIVGSTGTPNRNRGDGDSF
jgi:hypothetical protein